MRAIVLRRPGQGVPFFIILVYWAHRRGSIVWPNALAWNASTVLKPSWVRIPPSPLRARGQGGNMPLKDGRAPARVLLRAAAAWQRVL